ncbi:MAG: peptide ABC transporter ATP-binding protein [Clostridiales bacterium]|nr:MAG: peptide ABC transporter ATP-binding protein [Clostridiales bacterium]
MLKLEKISKTYKKGHKKIFYAAKDITFHIEVGKCVGLIGDSGSGKSTIANIVAGLTKATSGKIYYKDNLLKYPIRNNARKEIQILFQHPEVAFNPKLKIIDSLKEPYKMYRESYELKDIIDDINNLGLKEEYLYRYPSELSGGEQQRLALARVLAVQPSLLILDEPTSMLDVISQAMIIDMLKEYKEKNNTSYLFITHDEILSTIFCDHIHHIENGELIPKVD